MFLSMVVGKQKISTATMKCTSFAGCFDGDVAVQCRAHCPMKYIQSFAKSHWMPPFGKRLCHTAPTATMVDDFNETQKY
jgi:hypothetical protein